MQRLIGVVQNYDWGSHELLATLRGEPTSAEPEAELWYGAHASAPSELVDNGRTLLAEIESNPVGQLGYEVVDRFGERLPFLMKLLAADAPLSIQAHPSIDQAKDGFAFEEAEGIPQDAPDRSFPDDNHKPELIAALTPFEALIGFRDAHESSDFLSELDIETAGWLLERLSRNGPKGVVEMMLAPSAAELDEMDIAEVSFQLGEACRDYNGTKWSAEADLLARLDQRYGGDPGVVVAALLNRVVLQPGEAAYLDAGNLHAYVGGLGVEIMANSDNVLRGGLTSKHINVAKLLEILVPDTMRVRSVPVTEDGLYITPAPEFCLTRLVAPVDRQISGPAIVLAVEQTASVSNSLEHIDLRPTESVWVPAGETVNVDGDGLAFLATVGATTTLVEG